MRVGVMKHECYKTHEHTNVRCADQGVSSRAHFQQHNINNMSSTVHDIATQ